MKKLLLLMIAFLMAINTQAQELEHLAFMGIPIDGPIKAFQKELKKKGFSHKSSDENHRRYEGLFSGEEAELWVYYDKTSKNVYKVAVLFPCYYEEIAKRKYLDYKYALVSKYNALNYSWYQLLYSNSGAKLEQAIKDGKCSSLNLLIEHKQYDGSEVSEISISKPVINKYEETDTVALAGIIMESLCNIGTITIKTFKMKNEPYSVMGVKYENCCTIIYDDRKNSMDADMKRKEDL